MNTDFPHVLLTGGAGYVGNRLVPELLREGYKVTVYDICYFGDQTLPLDNPNLTVVKGDIRDINRFKETLFGVNAVLHLACISNDASFELDEGLSTSINLNAFEPLVVEAKAAGVKRFVYCSSSSVYGVSDQPDVTEDHPLVPLTLYNKYKGMCEPVLFKHMADDFTCVVIRPATVCGYSPRCRLDLSVNILTNHAINKGEITVFGGSQKRPNLNIEDMVRVYKLMLDAPKEKIQGEIFNAGYQNNTIMELAQMVKKVVEEEYPNVEEIGIKITDSDDNRSYHINSDKIRKILGFKPEYSIEDAVRTMCKAFKDNELPESFDRDWYYNVRTMKAIGAE
ncbi:MAG: UDP-glucose 4-epimerase [Rhodospirillaceae bacterium]|nr:UDP-glucose 4-epimerase [Rhodospirillaceae bacterium]|tara:strand:- start:13678 stop:14691 length:1014 start_codon:yes stop_codon:yes gene_type:complete